MDLGTVRYGGTTTAVHHDRGVITPLPYADVRAFLEGRPDPRAEERNWPAHLDSTNLDWAPVVLEPRKIVCVGLNFLSHIREMNREVPTYPTLFSKFADCLLGARDPIVLPGISHQVDWEAELAVVIGRSTWRCEPDEAREAIAGFTVANDISMRDFQHRTTQWLQGKTFDRTTPLGPLVVPGADLDWATDLRIRCSVDDVLVQEMRTSDMIFGPESIVSYVSQFTRLAPGDVVLMGTGSGVGAGRNPAVFLQPGQVLTTEIDGIGTLVNPCVPELDSAGRT